uniref:Putative acetyltransferase n=1 Tax=viral metagenome TaxID=1070528 RepID=A0A6M3IPD8_9ZZZZ
MVVDLDLSVHGPEVFKQFEQASKFVKVDPEYCRRIYSDMIGRGMAKGFILIEDGNIHGGIGGLIGPDLHNGEKTAVETFWFVAPGFRGGLGAYELWRKFEEWAKEQGCKKVAMIHLSDSYPERLERIYKARGYKLLELHYVKEL